MVRRLDVCDLSQLNQLLRRHGFRFSKSMGQNFLIAPWVPHETAAASGAADGIGVLEIGPGVGPLTAQLAQRAERVVAVELDRSLLPLLEETLRDYANVRVIEGDILKQNIPALCRAEMPNLRLVACANLPYNITSPAITALLEANCFEAITVMVQREVALRVCAEAGTADYGAFSIFCRYHADCELLFDVSPDCFHPAPKVTSSVLRLIPRGRPPVPIADEAMFFRVVRASFAQRRKTLLNGLHAVFGASHSKEALAETIRDCGFQADVRGERLSLTQFAQLAEKLADGREK